MQKYRRLSDIVIFRDHISPVSTFSIQLWMTDLRILCSQPKWKKSHDPGGQWFFLLCKHSLEVEWFWFALKKEFLKWSELPGIVIIVHFFYRWIALQWDLYDVQSGNFNDSEMVQIKNWEPALEMDFSEKPKD